MDGSPDLLIGGGIFLLVAIADLYFDEVYFGIGRRVLQRLTAGRYPAIPPTRPQRLVSSAVGGATIVAALFLLLFFANQYSRQ